MDDKTESLTFDRETGELIIKKKPVTQSKIICDIAIENLYSMWPELKIIKNWGVNATPEMKVDIVFFAEICFESLSSKEEPTEVLKYMANYIKLNPRPIDYKKW